jgi:glucose-6-phosphate isomerase
MNKKTSTASIKTLANTVPPGGDDMAGWLADAGRTRKLCLSLDDLTADFSRQAITGPQFDALIDHARATEIAGKRDAMLGGEKINISEGRAVLHTQLRDSQSAMAMDNIKAMTIMTERLLAAGIEDVVSIGIGGSALGPKMVLKALTPFHQGPEIHFASTIDPSELGDLLADLNPVTTAFMVISKTFTTRETMANWSMARHWLEQAGIDLEGRVFAVTNAVDAALGEGFAEDSILTMDEAIGGRFSLWSAVGLAIMVAFGREVFIDMLAGAETMDRHFAEAAPEENLPIVGGLMRFWNSGLRRYPGLAVIPYESRLERLPAWLQQLEMESNGKTIAINGEPAETGTAPIIFGVSGSSAEHSFFQMLHQGAVTIPVDLLAARKPMMLATGLDTAASEQQRALLVQMMAQADALSIGRPDAGFPGGRPVTVMTWDETSPFALGRLLAYYEHVTAVSGWLYGLNSFDQPGVELGKRLAQNYLDWLEDANEKVNMPSTTVEILKRFCSR